LNHWIIAPVILPALIGALIVLAFRNHTAQARMVSIATCVSLLVVAAGLIAQTATGEIQVYPLGNWPPPFGIPLVLDRLSAVMLLLTAVLALAVVLYATATGLDRAGRHFHALLQFLLLGVNGAFLTGDLFNLFVFFEVLLIASYGLMLHGGGKARLKAGVQYVVINLVGSTLFLVAVGILYGVTGSLNMADMALRIAAAPPGDQGLIIAGALLLSAVFALKAAIVPLHFWLPRTYANTSPAVAALFMIMTKIGAYSIIRTSTLMFGEDAGASAWTLAPWLMPAALVTGVAGFIGVLAARGLRDLAAYAVIGSMGTLLAAVAVFQPAAMAGALYYMVHSTLAGAALFLLFDMISARRGDYADTLAPAPPFRNSDALAAVFLLTAAGVVGLPPLSGFVGKLLILNGVGLDGPGAWVWAMILATTLLAMVAFARAGSSLFWKSAAIAGTVHCDPSPRFSGLTWAVQGGLVACLVLLSAAAGPVTGYLEAASLQLFDPDQYIRAVLGGE